VRSYLCVKTVALFLLLSFSVIGLGQSPVIEITGADEALAANIRGHLSIHGEACDTPMARLERLRGQVRENASRAGQALGYYQLSSEPRFSAGDSCWHLVLVITPGERVRVHEVSIHLSESYEKNLLFQEILAELPDLSGSPLDHGHYENIKNILSTAAVEEGYFSARFDRAEIRLDLKANQAQILIEFDPGTQKIPEPKSLHAL